MPPIPANLQPAETLSIEVTLTVPAGITEPEEYPSGRLEVILDQAVVDGANRRRIIRVSGSGIP